MRRKKFKNVKALAVGWIMAGMLVPFTLEKPAKGFTPPVDPTSIKVELNSTQSIYDNSQKPTVEEVKAYIKQIFGKDWKVAWAVAQNECNSSRAEWPKCKNSWEKEFSIGLLQINIAKDNGRGAKVHWDKIPGETLEEKEEYLLDWRQNILIAHVIYAQSGFWPWTAYSSGAYLKDL